ncbi:MAG: DUF368 domain-containing protein [archaeon]|nr:DUF368 domain-containing protein [archaeon]
MSTIKSLIVGTVIGIASMLPGISGATMAVVFGIYEHILRDLADLKTYIIKDFKFILMLIVGVALGTFLCAKVLDSVLNAIPTECMLFFIGLIAGQIIPLYRSVSKEKGERFTTNNGISFVMGLFVMVLMLIFGLFSGSGDVEVNTDLTGILIMFLIGVIIAISAILPGLSHATILLVFGLMTAFIDALHELNFLHIIPMFLGALFGAIGFAKIFNKALENHHLTALLFILGLTAGSIFVILQQAFSYTPGIWDILLGAVLMVVGFIISFYSDKANEAIHAEDAF